LQQPSVALTRRPVKDKGALMQTLHLRFRDLRAISLGQRPGRWPSPSMRSASTWKGAPPLPNHPRPTADVGSRPVPSRQQLARCPTVGAGLPLASPFREPSVCGAVAPDGSRVCPWQARASETLRAVSGGLSFPLRPQRYGARAGWKRTADTVANVGALTGVSSRPHRPRLSSAGG
jgi:hypothetical protein